MQKVSRRGFLKIAGLSFGGLAFDFLPPEEKPPAFLLARCTAATVPVLEKPDSRSAQKRLLALDEVVTVLEEVRGENGPAGNPRWFRLLDGFAHTAYLQEVAYRFQPIQYLIPDDGRFVEISVPYTTVRRSPGPEAQPLFQVYFQSVHWVREVRPDIYGGFWYGIRDDRSPSRYFIRADHARVFRDEEVTPIALRDASEEKRVEVDLTQQKLTALEGSHTVFHADISSGAAPGKTATPQGEFRVFRKMPCQHLGNTRRGDSSQEPFDLPGVPWVAYYQADNDGYAFHGAYWHNDFGRPHSHGCINLRPPDARWLYRWLDPQGPVAMFTPEAPGTRVRIFSS